MKKYVYYSFGGHDAIWYNYPETEKRDLTILFQEAKSRWNDRWGKLKALYILEQEKNYIQAGEKFYGFDNRLNSNNAFKYYLEYGLIRL